MCRDQHHQLRLVLLQVFAAKQITENRDVADARELGEVRGNAVVQQAGDHKALSILQLELSRSTPRSQCRNPEARQHQGVGKIQRADLGPDHQMNGPVGHDQRREVQFDPEFLVLNGDRAQCDSGLRHRNREFTACQEAGFFSVDRNQVGFRQDLQKVLFLKQLQGNTQVQIGAEDEQIEWIDSGKECRETLERRADGVGHVHTADGSELSGGGSARRVRRAGGEDVGAQLHDRSTVKLNEANLQQHLLCADRAKGQDVDYVLGVGRGDCAGTVRSILVDDVSGENQRAA